MLKVLIVDDETIFRLGIRSSVAWNEIGCSVCGEAPNGKEALKMIYERKPDIVFLDIKMPVMDGLEVLRELKDQKNDIYFVILSCFNEFDYVREAMKLGAYDYLFKPVMGLEDITRIIEEIKNDIYKKGSRTEQKKDSDEEIQKLLGEILQSGFTEEFQKKLMLQFPEILTMQYICFDVFLMRAGIPTPEKNDPEVCKAIIQETCSYEKLFFSWEKESGKLQVLCFDNRLSRNFYKEKKEEFSRVQKLFHEYTQAESYITVSRAGKSLESLKNCAEEADMARCGYFFTGNRITFYRPSFEESYDLGKIFQKIFQQLQDALMKKNMEKVYELVKQLKQEVLEKKYYNIYDYCHFIATVLVGFMRKFQQGEILEKLLLKDYDFISSLYHQSDIEKTNEKFLHVLEVTFEEAHGVSVESVQDAVARQVMNYVQENYARKISLDEISELVHLNKNYFCKMFKKVTGMNLGNYIMELRVEKATKLLETTDKRIYEIAFEVGFQSYPHFCKTYKKCRGISPTDIRRRQLL